MSNRVFILGSCVSRDPFELPYERKPEIVKYVARTSLASQVIGAFSDEGAIHEIESNFQRNMVLGDMEKTLLRDLEELTFEALVVDFIDDRFPILFSGAGGATLSSEYIEARAKAGAAELNWEEVVSAKSHLKMQWWEQGFANLVALAERKRPKIPIIVNRVYWADRTINGDALPSWTGNAREENDYLDSLYDRCSKAGAVRFIEYHQEFLADPSHVWGLSPFHYTLDIYQTFLEKLGEMISYQPNASRLVEY